MDLYNSISLDEENDDVLKKFYTNACETLNEHFQNGKLTYFEMTVQMTNLFNGMLKIPEKLCLNFRDLSVLLFA